MTKRLFLHVGMPKCATTTVQAWLKANRAGLAARGIFYDLPPGYRERDQGNGVMLARHMMAGNRAAATALLDPLLARDGDVVISSENFFGVARGPEPEWLVETAAGRGFETRILCYLRRQDEWIESDYKQQVKGGSDWTGTLAELIALRRRKQVLNYPFMLDIWARYVGGPGAVHALVLRAGQERDWPVRAFLDVLGAGDFHAAAAPRSDANVSPPAALIEPARHLKAGLLRRGFTPGQAADELARFFAEMPGLGGLPDRKFLLTGKARAELVESYEAANADLAERYLGGAGFDPLPPEHGPSERPLGREAAAVLARWWLHHRPQPRWRDGWRRRLARLRRPPPPGPRAGQAEKAGPEGGA